jgi:glycosyltransferase involved in cell wall biosynthesis
MMWQSSSRPVLGAPYSGKEVVVAMRYNIRLVSTYPPRRCGIGTFSRDLTTSLGQFVTNVASVRVAAIDKSKEIYHTPVDLVIDQYSLRSWSETAGAIIDMAHEAPNPTVVVLQHEYGLDPDDARNDGQGRNYIRIAEMFREADLMVIASLHTAVNNPTDHQTRIMRDLAKFCDALLVTADGAIDILSSDRYGIPAGKIKHIDHGIRIRNASEHDRIRVKQKHGMQSQFLVTTLGMHSPNKGIAYGIRAYAEFLKKSCTEQQRRHLTYLIAGQCHPEFRQADGGKPYKEYHDELRRLLNDCALRWCEIDSLAEVTFEDHDVVFLDTFLDETLLLELYAATNLILLPYLNKDQISSGILADALGAGRVTIATKFTYAVELLNPKSLQREGVVIDPPARGVLVDLGEPSVHQISQALDYFVFNEEERLAMEARAHERGHRMRWDTTAWELIQHIAFLVERQRVTGKDIALVREKPSLFTSLNGSTAVQH